MRRSALVMSLLVVSVLLGSKALYLIEASLFPFDDYVPLHMRAAAHGFRIPGGILALGFAIPLGCGALGLPWRRFGDTVIPLAALALVLIRLGCYLNGCCFGRVSSLSWAVTFPPGSWAFWYHHTHGWIPPDATISLPVHPLQLYFVLVAIGILVALVVGRQSDARPGRTQVLFYALFFGTTAILDLFRQNHLTLNVAVCSVTAVLVMTAAAFQWIAHTIGTYRTCSSSLEVQPLPGSQGAIE